MRKTFALLLAVPFLILFLTAVTLNQVVETASEPDVIIGMVNDAEAYDYVYDHIILNIVRDLVERGVEVNSGLGDSSAPTVLSFDDPEATAMAIFGLIETIVPREYVKEKFEEGLRGLVPYLKGEVDEFTIDLEIQDRVRAVPEAVRSVVIDLKLTEQVVDDLLVPQIAEFNSKVSGDALGIQFSPEEIRETAQVVFEVDWLERQLFDAIDEITPYFAGDADSFNVVLNFADRIVIIGKILKDKLNREDTLYTLVFAQVLDPLIQQTVAQSTSVGFGISLTEQEVADTFEVVAPPNWVREQGDGVIDALIDYMVGNTDDLNYTVALTDRKISATFELQALARQKLNRTLGGIPGCGSPADAIAAAQDLTAGQLPRCLAGGQTTIDLALNTFGPIMDAQVESFVSTQVPDQVSYSLADFESQVGGGLATVLDLRDRVIEGVSFTDQDLISLLADENDPAAVADAEELLQILAAGVVITEKTLTDGLTPDSLQQLDNVRGYVNLRLSLRLLLWVVVLIPLLVIGFIGGRGWAGRLKWTGGVAAVCALIVYGGIAVGWSFIDVAKDQIPDYEANLSSEFRADFPRLAVELTGDGPVELLQTAFDSWQRGWRNQTLPWMFAGVLVFAAASVWPRASSWRRGRTVPWPPLSRSRESGSSRPARPVSTTPSVIVVEVPAPDDDGAEGDDVDGDTRGDPGGEENIVEGGAPDNDSDSDPGPEPKPASSPSG